MESEPPVMEETTDEVVEPPAPAERRGSSLPLVLTIAALLLWFAFQSIQLVLERNNLITMRGNMEAPMQESQKMQGQLQALISKTAELANQGNAGAKAVVSELEKRGIPIQGAAPPSK
jgi:hypothetical protein